MKRVAGEWERFSGAVLPPNCSAVQRTEMEKAFYAGAGVMLAMLGDVSLAHSQEVAVAITKGLHEEVAAFLGGVVQRGIA